MAKVKNMYTQYLGLGLELEFRVRIRFWAWVRVRIRVFGIPKMDGLHILYLCQHCLFFLHQEFLSKFWEYGEFSQHGLRLCTIQPHRILAFSAGMETICSSNIFGLLIQIDTMSSSSIAYQFSFNLTSLIVISTFLLISHLFIIGDPWHEWFSNIQLHDYAYITSSITCGQLRIV